MISNRLCYVAINTNLTDLNGRVNQMQTYAANNGKLLNHAAILYNSVSEIGQKSKTAGSLCFQNGETTNSAIHGIKPKKIVASQSFVATGDNGQSMAYH